MTPIRRQYLKIKQQYLDAILLFRLGDFYETFDDDARLASHELDIVLTSRSMGGNAKVPMAGIPAHAVEPYLARLIKKGHKVAICEQLSAPTDSKGIVERDVVRVVTPGTVLEPSLLEQKANNYLAAVVIEGNEAGLSYVDITTGEFATAQMSLEELGPELERVAPAEILLPTGQELPHPRSDHIYTPIPPACVVPRVAQQCLLDHFGVVTLESFGCEALPLAVGASGAIIEYLAQTRKASTNELTSLNTYSTSAYMTLDQQTRRNLELVQGGRWGGGGTTLLSILDLTKTSMGGRLLRRWLGQPLLDLGELTVRQDAVAFFFDDLLQRESTQSTLSRVTDLERVLNRIRTGVVTPRELLGLKASLEAISALAAILNGQDAEAITWLVARVQPRDNLVALINAALDPDPSGEPGDGKVINPGFSEDLDQLRSASQDARGYIASLELSERERTGIKGLKVGYNRVFGYYIEVSSSYLSQVPSDYVRRQTLVGGERYITPDLKEHESLILNAKERVSDLERSLFKGVCQQIGEEARAISMLADGVAHIDVYASLAEVASRNNYVRPTLTDGDSIEIKGGRHPVVENVIPLGTFVPNDTYLSTSEIQLVLLTGPNMAGKSTFIRQVALITLLAQIGSFVPAESATIGMVDRIFTRVGLQDDLASGQSTFMVEMVETAAILNQATPRSLVILDEIGRGTSTYDGLSIARSAAEYIHNSPHLGCKTLFATHYHELTQLANTLPRVRNFNVAVTEEDGRVVFLHSMVPGGADKSYGIHVAQLAGLPKSVVIRAWEVLADLEEYGHGKAGRVAGRRTKEVAVQMPLLGGGSEVVEHLLEIDVANMTPLEAINVLYQLQQRAKGSDGANVDLDGSQRP